MAEQWMPISEGCCSLSSASTPDFFPSITYAPSDPIATSFERKVLNFITVSADRFMALITPRVVPC